MLKYNRDQMILYHAIATTQARAAGRNSQLAISVGFLVLLAGAVVAIVSEDATTKVVTTALAGLGGIFSGYITKTFFEAQDRAIKQLYNYWQQPLATSYLLAAERIVEQAKSETMRDEQLAKLITSILDMTTGISRGDNGQTTSNVQAPATAVEDRSLPNDR